MTHRLTDLERDVMARLVDGDDPTLQIVREQFHSATVSSRELTGVGFFTYFTVPDAVPLIPRKGSFSFGDVIATVDTLQNGAGFNVDCTVEPRNETI